MGEVEYIQKEKKAGMQYTIVSHDAVTAKVRPLLHKHGVIYYPVRLDPKQDGNRTEAKLAVRFANIDEPSDFIDVETLGYGVDNQDKGPGKAISYAVKYALLKVLGLETGDDPEHDAIEHKPASSTAAEYVSRARDIVGVAMTKQNLRDWWKAEAAARREAGLTQKDVKELQDAMAKKAETLPDSTILGGA
jgi:hypothetical protein